MTKTAPDTTAQMAAMRAGGWTVPAIASRFGVSQSTVKRACKRAGVTPGEDAAELQAAARRALIDTLDNSDELKAMLAGLLVDTAAQIAQSREKAAEALEALNPNDTESAALAMRALAAHSTTLGNHVVTLKRLIPDATALEELPELIVQEMTAEDVEQMRRQQREQECELGYDSADDTSWLEDAGTDNGSEDHAHFVERA